MPTLLEISDDLIAFRQLLEELCDETGGELPAELAESLDSWFAELDQNRDAKLDAYCALIREMTLRRRRATRRSRAAPEACSGGRERGQEVEGPLEDVSGNPRDEDDRDEAIQTERRGQRREASLGGNVLRRITGVSIPANDRESG
jgi:hypothetical protein